MSDTFTKKNLTNLLSYIKQKGETIACLQLELKKAFNHQVMSKSKKNTFLMKLIKVHSNFKLFIIICHEMSRKGGRVFQHRRQKKSNQSIFSYCSLQHANVRRKQLFKSSFVREFSSKSFIDKCRQVRECMKFSFAHFKVFTASVR